MRLERRIWQEVIAKSRRGVVQNGPIITYSANTVGSVGIKINAITDKTCVAEKIDNFVFNPDFEAGNIRIFETPCQDKGIIVDATELGK